MTLYLNGSLTPTKFQFHYTSIILTHTPSDVSSHLQGCSWSSLRIWWEPLRSPSVWAPRRWRRLEFDLFWRLQDSAPLIPWSTDQLSMASHSPHKHPLLIPGDVDAAFMPEILMTREWRELQPQCSELLTLSYFDVRRKCREWWEGDWTPWQMDSERGRTLRLVTRAVSRRLG